MGESIGASFIISRVALVLACLVLQALFYGWGPVSYTHLDVYKRQTVFRQEIHGLGGLFQIVQLRPMGEACALLCLDVIPVSYTHLDVYKRQVSISPVPPESGLAGGDQCYATFLRSLSPHLECGPCADTHTGNAGGA